MRHNISSVICTRNVMTRIIGCAGVDLNRDYLRRRSNAASVVRCVCEGVLTSYYDDPLRLGGSG